MPPKPFQTAPPPGNQVLQMLKPMGEILRRASSVEIGSGEGGPCLLDMVYESEYISFIHRGAGSIT